MKVPERPCLGDAFTMPLGAIRLKDLGRAGGKAAHLGEMLGAGLPVPTGFVVTTEAARRFLQSDPRIEHWLKSLEQCDVRDSAALRAAAEMLRRNLDTIPMPDDVADAVVAGVANPPACAWAVRSSATMEDLPEASFAGQHDSFLNVRGGDAVVAAVKSCWLSLFSERAVFYRIHKGISAGRAQMAVVVQQLIAADAAGVMFTISPGDGDSGMIFIEAAFGLGEAVVQGLVTPDRIEVSRADLKVVRRIGAANHADGAPVFDPARFNQCNQRPGSQTGAPTLNDEMAAQLGRLGLEAERLFGAPQDLEWARRDDQLFLLQSRPITGRAPARTWEDRQIWSNFNTGEIAPDVMTLMTWSLLQSLAGGTAFRSIARLLGADIRRAPMLGVVAGRLYFNANTAMAVLRPFSFLFEGATNLFQAIGGGQPEAYRQALAIPPEDLPDLGFSWPKYLLSWPRILFDLITHRPRCGEAWKARFKAQTDQLVRTDVEAMATPDLIHACTRQIREPFKDVDLLYLALPAAALPLLQKAFRDWLDNPDIACQHRLFSALGGLPTAEAGLALWRLAALAHADLDTERATRSENQWAQISTRLRLTEHGRKFLAAWDVFMAEHGHHCRGELELFNARWSETPDYVLEIVRSYLRSIGQTDPIARQRQLAAEREQLVAQYRRQLKNPVKRWIFSWSLRRAQKLAVFREDLKSLGVRQLAFARRVLLTLGQRLHEQGILSGRDDIFFLDISEIEPVATGGAPFDWRERIEARRREYEKNLKLSPPPLVIGKFKADAPAWPAASADSKLLEGIAASPGVAVGPARVILRADNREQVLPGEILVAPFTDPAWSPYFVAAAGLVVEQGGILSHGSIVAREYGLPAVTNADSATRVIRTGDLVQVDGTRGRVTILSRGP